MKRSKWKSLKLTNKLDRNRIIMPDMIKSRIKVSNGKDIRIIKITVDHVNHRLGEFSHTKVTPRYKKKK